MNQLPEVIKLISTTGSKLAEQQYSDSLKTTTPTDVKRGLAYAFNRYAQLNGLPLLIEADSPTKIVKIAIAALRTFHGRLLQSKPTKTLLSTKWLETQLKETWGLR